MTGVRPLVAAEVTERDLAISGLAGRLGECSSFCRFLISGDVVRFRPSPRPTRCEDPACPSEETSESESDFVRLRFDNGFEEARTNSANVRGGDEVDEEGDADGVGRNVGGKLSGRGAGSVEKSCNG